MSDSPADLARTWLRAWDTGDLSLLRLAPDFVHTSPFGRIEGREEYLRIVEPMSRKSVVAIRVKDVIEGDGKAAIAYELETSAGTVEACDWIFVENGLIREINAYYDSTTNRKALESEGIQGYEDAK
jgi:SnoaL-like domain